MSTAVERLAAIGVTVPEVMVPAPGVDLFRWAVIACDQYTSEPEYWAEVDRIVGDHPSTLRLIFPEVYLSAPGHSERISSIGERMETYLRDRTILPAPRGMVLTIRSTPHVAERRGLLLAVDLERYDYRPHTAPLVRPSEQTIVERIPPRVAIRSNAALELPHVMVLMDDPENALFGNLDHSRMERLYATELMLNGGSVAGFLVRDDDLEHVAECLEDRLSAGDSEHPMLFAVGDGNHSLATAKTVWERLRPTVGPDHPARYALVEVVNAYDPGLRFEPIHRLVRTSNPDRWVESLAHRMGSRLESCPGDDIEARLRRSSGSIGVITASGTNLLAGEHEETPVVRLQEVLDGEDGLEVDYIHGLDSVRRLGRRPGAAGIILPDFDPAGLFPTVTGRGVLPRKAFSLGSAEEKRYYLECRRIG